MMRPFEYVCVDDTSAAVALVSADPEAQYLALWADKPPAAARHTLEVNVSCSPWSPRRPV